MFKKIRQAITINTLYFMEIIFVSRMETWDIQQRFRYLPWHLGIK
jgi:hypothetical protein